MAKLSGGNYAVCEEELDLLTPRMVRKCGMKHANEYVGKLVCEPCRSSYKRLANAGKVETAEAEREWAKHQKIQVLQKIAETHKSRPMQCVACKNTKTLSPWSRVTYALDVEKLPQLLGGQLRALRRSYGVRATISDGVVRGLPERAGLYKLNNANTLKRRASCFTNCMQLILWVLKSAACAVYNLELGRGVGTCTVGKARPASYKPVSASLEGPLPRQRSLLPR